MSKYDAERKKLGLSTGSTSSVSTEKSKYDGERQLLDPTVRYGTNDERAGSARAREDAERKQRDEVVRNDPISNEIRIRPLKFIDSIKETDKRNDAKAKRLALMERNSLNMDDVSKRVKDERTGRNLPVVGPVLGPIISGLEKVADFTKPASDLALEYYTPGAGLSVIQGGSQAAGNIVGKLLPGLGKSVAGKVGKTALTEGIVGAPLSVGNQLAREPNSSNKQLLEATAYGAGGGALLGGGGKAIGAGIEKGVGAVRNKLNDVTESQFRSILDSAKGSALKLRNPGATQQLDKVMGEIKPIVTERLTPPFENPKLLAKWVRDNFDKEMSMKEVSKLTHDDLVDMAEGLRSSQRVYDEAVRVAKERGYNLTTLLDGNGNTIAPRVTQDASRRAYGIYPETLPNVRREMPVSKYDAERQSLAQDNTMNAAKMKGNWFADFMRDLFTSKSDSMGISAFGKKVGQKLRTPDNPERVTDLIDVGGRVDRKENGSRWEKFYTAIANEQAPLPRAVKQIGGKNVPFENDPSKLAWLSRGWKGKADTKLQYGFMDESGEKIGASLKEAIEPIKNRLNDLREYSVALRSLEYGDLDSGVPRELAEKTIQKYSNDKQLQTAYESFKKYIDDMNHDTLVQSGLWSEAKQKFYKETQPNYMPMFRTEEKGLRDGIQGAGGKGFANVKDPTKKRTGSRKPIVDPVESVIKQTYKNQALAERNNVMRSLVELAESNPDNGIIAPVRGSSALDEVQRSLDTFIENPTGNMEKQLTDALDLFKPQTVNGQKNVFTVMRNGKAEQWQITDDQLAKVVAGLGGEPSNPLINMVGKATGVLKAGLVLAPDFVVKNLVRDQMSAFINSKYGFVPLWDTVSGLVSAARKDDAFYKWMGSGGANGAWVSLERDYLQGQIRDLTQKSIRKLGNPIEIMRKLSEWSEQGTRLGEFKRGLKKGASLKEAALASRDVTLDFSRIGSKTKSANKAIAFFNVAIQSMDKMVRQFKDRPVATPVKALTSITIPSIGLYLLNHKNPKYEELPQWEKDTNWHFFVGDQVIKVPKPFEMGTIFGTFFERMMRDVKENDPEAFEGFAKQALEGFTPSVIPTLITPWIEAYANKDMFSKAPIIPRREQGLLPKDQYGPYTSEIAKGVGKLSKTSPRVVENYITGYTGTLGRYALQSADKVYTNAKDIKTPAKADGGLSDFPVLRSFASKGLEGSSQSVDDFYKERDRLTRERASAKKSQQTYEHEAKYKEYNKIADSISDEQAKVRAVMEDMVMTSAQKREELKVLNLRIINIARQAKGLKPVQ